MAVDANGMPLRVFITDGTTADCTQASKLIEGISATYVLADKGYDSEEIIRHVEDQGMIAVIPPRSNRKTQRSYDKALYKLRHRIENTFLHIKKWRGVATRYAKNAKSFLALLQIRCIALWVRIP